MKIRSTQTRPEQAKPYHARSDEMNDSIGLITPLTSQSINPSIIEVNSYQIRANQDNPRQARPDQI
eukprot:1761571-Lingulodinium_polyedra.AAC.1